VPPFAVPSPWWPDTVPVIEHLDALLGVPVTVLRLLRGVGEDGPAGGEVTYHVEVPAVPAYRFRPYRDDGSLLGEHPLRAAWARPGGVARIVAWVDDALAALGRRRTGPVAQVKTWNLSCVLRVPTDRGTVWCKSTRVFETPEQAAISLVAAVDRALVPVVLAHRPGDLLFADVPGTDCWEPSVATVRAMVRRWVAVQAAVTPDGSVPVRLPAQLPDRLRPVLPTLPADRRAGVQELVDTLPARLAALNACGLPATLVHGDFHSGNWRRGPAGLTLMDWSDAFIGHPANDLVRLVAWHPALRGELHDTAVDAWCSAWQDARPGCDPRPALELVRPLVFLEAACFYQRFLDGIEPAERPYHDGDPTRMVDLALAVAQPVR
jgi:hypothetical protein